MVAREGRAMRQPTRLRSKLSAIVCATILASVSASAKEGETRTCETKLGGQVVCGDYVIGITLEQYEAGLKKRAEEIRAEETEKRTKLQNLLEKQVQLTERATSAEKDSLGAERKFVEIADTVRKIKEKADVVEARAIFEAGKLAAERIDWRADYTHYARAARLQVRPACRITGAHDGRLRYCRLIRRSDIESCDLSIWPR